MAKYVPHKGDFIALNFDPQAGHEQKGRRPGLVVSNYLFNKHTGLALVCPLTNTDRRIPFHLPVPADSRLTGFVMIDQVKSVDFITRKASFLAKAPEALVEDALAVLTAMTN
ncbi:MAG TPA: type II toxin-antitoxin system PemK/MazF family toxin [Candidatus Acidoferrum sp.]|nr:type II toxin-antitoxin system PemK/MazF family toxin [Candidatus Acidoferrum sp.]